MVWGRRAVETAGGLEPPSPFYPKPPHAAATGRDEGKYSHSRIVPEILLRTLVEEHTSREGLGPLQGLLSLSEVHLEGVLGVM